MEFRQFALGDLQTNCYLLWSGTEAGVIDPGGPAGQVAKFIDSHGLALKWILNTHGHSDHIAGNRELQDKYGAPIIIHPADRGMLTSSLENLSVFIGNPIDSPDAAMTVNGGSTLVLGTDTFQVIETPGHTGGGIALYYPGVLFAGDALFYQSIGRSDFPGGDHRQLVHSIRERLLVLPPDTVVLPGHGPATTIGDEIRWNPFLQEDNELPY